MPLAEPRRDELAPPLRFLAGGGAASRLILARDWTDHPLGPPAGWPETLKTALSLILNSPESMILCWGEAELHFFFNQTYIPLLGPRVAWATGMPFRRVWADAWEQAQPIIADAFAGRSQRFCDLPWKLDTDRGAADTWFTFSYSRILGLDGEIAGLFILTNETTERVLADTALRDSQAALSALNATLEARVEEAVRAERRSAAALDLYQNIVMSTPGPVMAFDRNLRVTAFNQAHVDKFLETQGVVSAVGHRFPDYFIPEERAAITALMQRSLAGETFVTRAEFGDPTLARLHWDLTHTPLRDASGEVIGGFHHAIDVTAQVEAERALAAAEEQLRQAQKMEAVGQLTGGIAHDFNNMLTGVIGSLDLLKRHIASGRVDRVDRYIDAAATSAQRAASLTHRLLAFSRRQSLDVRPIDVNALVAGMEELLARTLGEGVALDVQLDTACWPAMTDENQLESALLNLAINARDAMPGGGRLTIATANVRLAEEAADRPDDVAAGDYVAIHVGDTGMGMDEATIARAFDPFFTTKPIGSGTGLGLSMIYGFARQSGGHVRLDSTSGEGTTATLYLPRHAGGAPAAGAAPAVDRPIGAMPGEQVLLVEDDCAVRLLVGDVLADLGYGVREARDGPTALEALATMDRLDLLVTDVGLPGIDGRRLADLMRERRPGLKVLFITGYAERAAVRGDFLAPGMEMIAKPFAIDTLAAKIRAMLA